jgi:hypothetical protein
LFYGRSRRALPRLRGRREQGDITNSRPLPAALYRSLIETMPAIRWSCDGKIGSTVALFNR